MITNIQWNVINEDTNKSLKTHSAGINGQVVQQKLCTRQND